MKKTLKWSAFSIALVLFIVTVAISISAYIDFSRFQKGVVSQVEQAIGRDITVNGSFDAHAGWWPSLEMHQVRVSNAAWVGESPMLTADTLIVELELFPLIIGQTRINSVTIEGATLALHRRGDKVNWRLGRAEKEGQKKEHTDGEPNLPVIEALQIKNSRITLQEDGDLAMELLIDQLKATGSMAAMTFDAQGKYEGTPWKIGGESDGLASLFEEDFTIKANGHYDYVAFDGDVEFHPSDNDAYAIGEFTVEDKDNDAGQLALSLNIQRKEDRKSVV